MVRTEHFLSAAFAALVFTTPLLPSAQPVTARHPDQEQAQPSRPASPSVIQATGGDPDCRVERPARADLQFLPDADRVSPQASADLSQAVSASTRSPAKSSAVTRTTPQLFVRCDGSSYTIFDGFRAQLHAASAARERSQPAERKPR